MGVWLLGKLGGAEELGGLEGCCHCTGGGYAMPTGRPVGAGKGRSDQLRTWVGGNDCGKGMERLGRGGSRFADGGGSNDRWTGVCKVGVKGALL